jgi:hypothetical protein
MTIAKIVFRILSPFIEIQKERCLVPYGNGPVFHVRSDKFLRDFAIGLKGPIAVMFF